MQSVHFEPRVSKQYASLCIQMTLFFEAMFYFCLCTGLYHTIYYGIEIGVLQFEWIK